MTVSDEARVWRFRVRGFAVAGVVCLALIFFLKIFDPTEFAKGVILPLVLLSSSFCCAGHIAPAGIGNISKKMKYDAADQKKPRVQNGIECTRLLVRCWSFAALAIIVALLLLRRVLRWHHEI